MADETKGGELGDFEDYDGDEEDPRDDKKDDDETTELEELQAEVDRLEQKLNQTITIGADNPLGVDPRIRVRDIAWDRAKPGAKVYVLAQLAPTVYEYEEAFPDAPGLDEYAGNILPRMSRADPVFACVYIKDSLTKVDTNLTAYPMPESRLTRFPAEQASMVGGSSVEFAPGPLPDEDDVPVAVSTGVANWPEVAREKNDNE